MRIAHIDLWRVRAPLVTPYPLSRLYGTLGHAEAVFVRLGADDGTEGWGEADPLQPFTAESAADVLAFLQARAGPLLIGRPAADRARILAEIRALRPAMPTAWGAIDMALHDLGARAAGVSVAALLGGPVRDRIPVLWPLGSGSLAASVAAVETRRAEGFRTFMIKTGARDVADDARKTLRLIARYSPEIGFIADANQGWSEAEALRYVGLIGAAPLALLEQPVARNDLVGLGRVRRATEIPISADESVVSLAQAAALAAAGAVDVFSLKPSKNGGLGAAARIAALAQGHGLGILMNSMIEFGVTQAASLQLGLTLANLVPGGHAYMSTLRLAEDPTDFGRLVTDGWARAPAGPGLGVAVDVDHLDRLSVAHHRLGSGAARQQALA